MEIVNLPPSKFHKACASSTGEPECDREKGLGPLGRSCTLALQQFVCGAVGAGGPPDGGRMNTADHGDVGKWDPNYTGVRGVYLLSE